jgi:hypothetical protein
VERTRLAETSIDFYGATWHHMSEDILFLVEDSDTMNLTVELGIVSDHVMLCYVTLCSIVRAVTGR